ncbi:MAG: winged helix-turn-helix transcriptional regulator [Candidatus Marsarchaeota archaeon]|nr:winged helix-turn-helix transcriptional regulator [Candidatus Marsarchaeota archaeon]
MANENLGFTNKEKIILRELSNDARSSLTKLAKKADCSVITVARIINKLTEKLDIRFTMEIDMDRLGLSDRHILTVKFKKLPDELFLRSLFKDDTYAQDVYLTKGNFDLLIFAATDTPINYTLWETSLATNLSEYLPDLRPSEFIFPQLGFVPLNDEFVNFIREEIKVDKYDRQILKLLNMNCRMRYREISKHVDLKEDTVRYRLFRLVRKGIIRRFTIAVQRPGYGYLLSYFLRYRFYKSTISSAFPQMRSHYTDENLQNFNNFPLIAPISGSYRSFGIVFGENKRDILYKGIKWHKILLKKEQVVEKHAFIIKTIKGLIPLRNLDASTNYRFIWG